MLLPFRALDGVILVDSLADSWTPVRCLFLGGGVATVSSVVDTDVNADAAGTDAGAGAGVRAGSGRVARGGSEAANATDEAAATSSDFFSCFRAC